MNRLDALASVVDDALTTCVADHPRTCEYVPTVDGEDVCAEPILPWLHPRYCSPEHRDGQPLRRATKVNEWLDAETALSEWINTTVHARRLERALPQVAASLGQLAAALGTTVDGLRAQWTQLPPVVRDVADTELDRRYGRRANVLLALQREQLLTGADHTQLLSAWRSWLPTSNAPEPPLPRHLTPDRPIANRSVGEQLSYARLPQLDVDQFPQYHDFTARYLVVGPSTFRCAVAPTAAPTPEEPDAPPTVRTTGTGRLVDDRPPPLHEADSGPDWRQRLRLVLRDVFTYWRT